MRLDLLNKIKFHCMLVTFFLIMSLVSFGQDTLGAKPYMWVPMKTGQERVTLFNKIKLAKIGRNCGTAQTNHFLLQNFLGFIQYLEETYSEDFLFMHVYIGICKGQQSVPTNFSKKLILIFAPASSESIQSDLKYYILPTKFDPKNPEKFEITKKEKDAWTTKFVASMPLETIDEGDANNQFPSDTNTYKTPSDTRYVRYCAGDLHDLIEVKKYYTSHGYDITADMLGYLGAYSDTSDYKNRILIQFEFLTKAHKIFYLDTIPGFLRLPDGASECFGATDNGQLCPTYCQ
jgi:hypothetical protein